MKKYNETKAWLICAAAFVLVGIILGVFVSLITTATNKNDAKKQMIAVSQYIKQQCISYEELAAEDASRSLYDVSDKSFSVRSAIDFSASASAMYEDVKSLAEASRLNGIIVTETDGSTQKIVCFYADNNDDGAEMWNAYLQSYSSVVTDLFKSYSERLTLNGYYYDYSMVARGDENGEVLCYKRQLAEEVEDNRFSVATLLKGYVFGSDGTVVVTDGKNVLAANTEGKVGMRSEDTEVVRKFRTQEVFDDLVRVSDDGVYYGIRTKCKDLYIYTYLSDGTVFANRSMILSTMYMLYLCAVALVIVVRQMTLNKKRAEQARIDEAYRIEKERLAQQAIRSNEAKTDFLRRMSHDIRTPINGIMGMVKIGEYYAYDPEKQKECRAKIRDASEYLLSLVNDMLYMNKLSTAEPEWKYEKFCLTDLLAETVTFMGAQAKESGITLNAEREELKHNYLYGGKVQLQRVFNNLITNAIKYNKPNGSVTVTAREVSFKDGYASFEFRCCDTGIGMDEEFIKKMYEPFERENRDEGKPLDGVGLGLSIVKKIVTKAGWNLTVDSKKDVGTTFTLEATFKVTEEWNKTADENSPDVDKEKLKGYNILVAEDNDLNAEIVEFILKVAGANVTRVSDGKQAIEKFAESEEGGFDVILMDVMMPDTDGLTATREIRKINRADAATVPIIAMTASSFAEDVANAREAGMNAHIAKPIVSDNLVKCILSLAKRGGGGIKMTLKEIYGAVGGNYADVVDRFASEETVGRFIALFLSDDSFTTLEGAMKSGDAETAFRAAHTLKGVAQNLGFGDLGRSASELTEVLRGNTFVGTAALFERVKSDYNKVIGLIANAITCG